MLKQYKKVFFSLLLAIMLSSVFFFSFFPLGGTKGLVFVIGDPRFEDYFDSLTLMHKRQLEAEYYSHWNQLASNLGNYWNCEFDCYAATNVPLSKFSFSSLFLLFVGHGYYDGEQYFSISPREWVKIEEFSTQITSDNVTIAVDSCFGLNWYSAFNHTNLNGLYTADTTNSTYEMTLIYGIDELTYRPYIVSLHSYGNYFISALLQGYSFGDSHSLALESMN